MAGKAEVTYDPDVLGAGDVARLIEDLGFSAALVEAGAAAAGTLDLRVSVSAAPAAAAASLSSATAFRSVLRLLRPQNRVQTGVDARSRDRVRQPGDQQRPGPLRPRDGGSARAAGHYSGAHHVWTGSSCPQPETSLRPLLFQDLGFQAELEKTGLKHNLDHSQEIQQ